MNYKDHFSTQSETYAKFRPKYPDELFRFLAQQCSEHCLAWDCATGNGQAAVPLAAYFKTIIATDASEQQLKHAVPHEKVTYKVALAEESGVETSSVDLLTVANGVHWFVIDKFYKEVDRVLKPHGVIAVWTYYDLNLNEKIDAIIQRLQANILGPYWPAEVKLMMTGYKDLPFPFEPIEHPEFKYMAHADLKTLLGFFNSWSATQRYIATNDKDPIDLVRKELLEAWGDAEEWKQITWHLALKVGRKRETRLSE